MNANSSSQLEPPSTRFYVVRGRVQGVGFRWFVDREARALGLAGWVRNAPDGTVEVLARGTAEQHVALRSLLERGSRGSRVDAVREGDAPDDPALTQFRIEGAW